MNGQSVPLAASGTRQGGGLIDLAWLTWRQHRWMIVVCVLGFGLVTGYLLWLDHQLVASCNGPCGHLGSPSAASTASHELTLYVERSHMALYGLVFASPLVGAFLAAPLVSREYEQRTNLLVWTQDLRATHWLAGKTALLVAVGAFLAGIVGFAASALAHRLDGLGSRGAMGSSVLFSDYFEATTAMQTAYLLFAFALGVALSVLVRRTVPAMGITLVVFVATRVLVGRQRPYFMRPIRHIEPEGQVHDSPADVIGNNVLFIEQGHADAAGNPASASKALECMYSRDMRSCFRDNGIVSTYIDYQPGSRLGTFHLIEEVIFAGLAVVLFALVWWRVRRATVIG